MSEQKKIQFSSDDIVSSTVYNVGQNMIVVTHDKIEICLTKHANSLGQRGTWLIPFGILITVLVTLATTDFHDRFGLKGEVWQAIFVMSAIITLIWTIVSLVKIVRTKTRTIPQIIAELEGQSTRQQSNRTLN